MLTQIRHLEDAAHFEEEIPYEVFGYPDLDSKRVTNCNFILIDNILVKDVRKRMEPCNLENEGFIFVKHKSQCSLQSDNFEAPDTSRDNDALITAYLEETMNLLKREIPCEKMICFDWRVSKTGR